MGDSISHNEVLEKLQEVGMGSYTQAHNTRLNRDVAIKVLHGGGGLARLAFLNRTFGPCLGFSSGRDLNGREDT